MNSSVLHVLDSSTTPDAMEMLTHLLAADRAAEDRVAVLGHRRTAELARLAGIQSDLIYLPSMGWADPSGWRALRQLVQRVRPGCLHAWGVPAVVAAATGFEGVRLASFAHEPTRGQMKLLRLAAARGERRGSRWHLTGSSSTVTAALQTTGAKVSRIRPGISMGMVKPVAGGPAALRQSLGIGPADGPIVLLGGEGARSRHDLGMWSAGIMTQLFPQLRIIFREPARGIDRGFDRLGENMASDEYIVTAPYEMHWSTLAQAADICLVTADGPIETNSILWAMAAGVPVIGTPVPCVAELVEHGHNGMLAKEMVARSIAARIEEYMADATLRWPLTDRARAEIYEQFKVSDMVAAFASIYDGDAGDAGRKRATAMQAV